MHSEKIILEKETSGFDRYVLAGDVSGTNTSLAIAGIRKDSITPLFISRFQSQELKGISDAINETLKYAHEKHNITIQDACLSPAGPISPERDYCNLTNVTWDIDVKQVLVDTELKSLTLINDFEAIGCGLPFLDQDNKDHLVMLAHPGSHNAKPVENGVKGIVGAGTGLGKSILIFNRERGMYIPIPSEGGHEDFPVTDSFEYELIQFIKDRRGGEAPVDFEDVLSGRGLASIYEFLIDFEVFDLNSITKEIEDADDKAPIISRNAHQDPACRRALELFVRFYARALRNFALNIMARGGIYMAGGIAAKNMDFFTSGALMKEFEINQTQHKVLRDIPVYVITNYNISIYGAANVAANFPELAIKK